MSSTIVLLEHDSGRIKRSSLSAINLARQLGQPYSLCLLGSGVGALAEAVRGYGASKVFVADHPALVEPLADRYAVVLAALMRSVGGSTLAGTASTFTKDLLPRVAALLDAPMVSEVTAAEVVGGVPRFQRPISAGSFFATVSVEGEPRVLTVRGTAFHPPEAGLPDSPVEAVVVDPSVLPDGLEFISRETQTSARPDLTEARVVVSGGRPLKDAATFERLIGGLADALGGAVGATRAAVDTGMAPNDTQVGQTGKSVAPELYIGVGVSGAIQHLAGMKDSRVIVAINRDTNAPIFQIASYGLVGDLHEVVPRLIECVRS